MCGSHSNINDNNKKGNNIVDAVNKNLNNDSNDDVAANSIDNVQEVIRDIEQNGIGAMDNERR